MKDSTVFLIMMAAVPSIMIYTKMARMDAKEMHEIQMRVKHRSEFWAKGNAFTTRLRDQMHTHLQQTADGKLGSTTS